MAEACTTNCPLLIEAIRRVEDNRQLSRDSDYNNEIHTIRAEQFEELIEVILAKCIDCPGINVESYSPPIAQCQAQGIAERLPSLGPGNQVFLTKLIAPQ